MGSGRLSPVRDDGRDFDLSGLGGANSNLNALVSNLLKKKGGK